AEAVARLAAFTGRKVRRLLLLGQAQLPDWPDVAVLRAGGLAEALSILSESDVDAVAAVAADPVLDVTGLLDWLRDHPRHPRVPVAIPAPPPSPPPRRQAPAPPARPARP